MARQGSSAPAQSLPPHPAPTPRPPPQLGAARCFRQLYLDAQAHAPQHSGSERLEIIRRPDHRHFRRFQQPMDEDFWVRFALVPAGADKILRFGSLPLASASPTTCSFTPSVSASVAENSVFPVPGGPYSRICTPCSPP